MVTGVATFSLLARFFGPSFLGELSIVQAISASTLFMVTLGLDKFVVKSLVEENDRAKSRVFFTAVILRFFGWCVYSVLLYCAVLKVDDNLALIALIEIVATLFLHVVIVQYVLEADGEAKKLAIATTVSRCAGLLYLGISIFLDWGFVVACCFLPLQSGVKLLYLIVHIVRSKKEKIKGVNFDYEWAKGNLKKAFPIMVSGAVFPLFIQADTLMIAYYYDSEEVGMYTAPMKIIFQISFVGVALMSAFFPFLVSEFNNKIRYERFLSVISRFFFLMSVVISIFVICLSGLFVDVLFGSQYESSKPVMMLLSIILIFLIPSKLYSALMILEGLAKFELLKAFVAVFMNVILNIVLIPKYSIQGAALASLISYFFADFLFYFISVRFKTISKYIKISLDGLLHPITTTKEFLSIKGGN